MPTIEEMDEFFDFGNAAHPTSSFFQTDLDLLALDDANPAFTQEGPDEDPFIAVQHFSASDHQAFMQDARLDTDMLGAEDLVDFPGWGDSMESPLNEFGNSIQAAQRCEFFQGGLREAATLGKAYSETVAEQVLHTQKNVSRGSEDISCLHSAPKLTVRPEIASLPSCVQQQCSFKNVHDPLAIGIESDLVNCRTIYRPDSPSQQAPFTDLVLTDSTLNDVQNSSNTWPPQGHPSNSSGQFPQGISSTDLSRKTSLETRDSSESIVKTSTRFSREEVRILRTWLGTHVQHPYPTEVEKDSLVLQTGLSKTQITNWLANARRRGKVRHIRSASPSVQNYAVGMAIPRRSTPALEQTPMERWQHSPPEHEPASVSAIAKAVTSSRLSSGDNSAYTDDGSNRSLCNASSASSFGTSAGSSGEHSFASAFSHKSRGSFGSFDSAGDRGRRRRRRQVSKPAKIIGNAPPRTFQCTFCTETFKTKHDWQRHEKSLHLSLESWICAPNGPVEVSAGTGLPACVYCGSQCTTPQHAEIHNHASCAEKTIEERTFYRKDHFRQHLHLSHDVKFEAARMNSWQTVKSDIRSKCGFCGSILMSWTARVDHLADHFKNGKSMAEWKGDWGFEPIVLRLVENGMPPYLIHDERKTMKPFEASNSVQAFKQWTQDDHFKHGLLTHIKDCIIQGAPPTDDELLAYARQLLSHMHTLVPPVDRLGISWFRDLIYLSGPQQDSSDHQQPRDPGTNSVDNLSFPNTLDTCPFHERDLRAYVRSRQALGLTPTESELQREACRVLDEDDKKALFQCPEAVGWFKYLINSSTAWLSDFRRRSGLPRITEMANEHVRSTDDKTIDYSIHNQPRLEKELKEYVQQQVSKGITPTDEMLRREARIIVFGSDDPWNQTWADELPLLEYFKRQNNLAPALRGDSNGTNIITAPPWCPSSAETLHWNVEQIKTDLALLIHPPKAYDDQGLGRTVHSQDHADNAFAITSVSSVVLRNFLNDANCYGRLYLEMRSFVSKCLSPTNATPHVPSDSELQEFARWTIFDDHDPWNQTAADNAEWLIRFKRDANLLPSSGGPGLSTDNISWQVSINGTGFSPPMFNRQKGIVFHEDAEVRMGPGDPTGIKFQVSKETATRYVNNMKERYRLPAKVFCSTDLEGALCEFVRVEKAAGRVPCDDALRAKARKVLGTETTAADEAVLLRRFKELVGIAVSPVLSPTATTPSQVPTLYLEESQTQNCPAPLASPTLPGTFDMQDILHAWDHDLMSMDFSNPPEAVLNSYEDEDFAITDFPPDLDICYSTLSQIPDDSPFVPDPNLSSSNLSFATAWQQEHEIRREFDKGAGGACGRELGGDEGERESRTEAL